MDILTIAVISLFFALLIGIPFQRYGGTRIDEQSGLQLDREEKIERRQIILADLELDYATGKISQSEYMKVKRSLQLESSTVQT
jgi:hypothetical protein